LVDLKSQKPPSPLIHDQRAKQKKPRPLAGPGPLVLFAVLEEELGAELQDARQVGTANFKETVSAQSTWNAARGRGSRCAKFVQRFSTAEGVILN
jgi:hypothetical protein